jgi:hypothetical protein
MYWSSAAQSGHALSFADDQTLELNMSKKNRLPKRPKFKAPKNKEWECVSSKPREYDRSQDPLFGIAEQDPLAMVVECGEDVIKAEGGAQEVLYQKLAIAFKCYKSFRYESRHWRALVNDPFWNSWKKNRPRLVKDQHKALRYTLMLMFRGNADNSANYNRAAKYGTALSYCEALMVDPEELEAMLKEEGIEAVYERALEVRRAGKEKIKAAAWQKDQDDAFRIDDDDDDDDDDREAFLGNPSSEKLGDDETSSLSDKATQGTMDPDAYAKPEDLSTHLLLEMNPTELADFLPLRGRFNLKVARMKGRAGWHRWKILKVRKIPRDPA